MYWQGSMASSGPLPNRNLNSPIQPANSSNNFPLPPPPNVGDGHNAAMNSAAPQQNPAAILPAPQPQQKELQAAALCRHGQETVQEIFARANEVFQTLRAAQPPDGKLAPGMDRKPKIQDTVRNIRSLFKRLRVIYEKIEESCPTTENIDRELEQAIPYLDEPPPSEDKRNTDAYAAANEEYKELVQVVAQNRSLRETMDQLRLIIWDVNTMLAMRKE